MVTTQKNFYTTKQLINEKDQDFRSKDSKIQTSLPKRFDFINCFNTVKNFIDNNPINKDTQERLELLLYNKRVEFNNNTDDNFLALPKEWRVKILDLLPL